jgi:phosphoribosylaminoimidazole-succinocarboxamide synthase
LSGLTLWWFEQLATVVPTQLETADVQDYPAELAPYADFLRGRSMLCRRLDMMPVECVARGYLTGGGYKDYVASGMVSGLTLPAGLLDGSRLPEPIFTPSTKAPAGELAETLREVTLSIYRRAAAIAERAGILLADTKVELGMDSAGVLTLGDEVLTPDSSRFWSADAWKPGQQQPSYDKQYVRDWLLDESGWDRESPPPALPDDVVDRTRAKYVEAYERLTGTSFSDYLAG